MGGYLRILDIYKYRIIGMANVLWKVAGAHEMYGRIRKIRKEGKNNTIVSVVCRVSYAQYRYYDI